MIKRRMMSPGPTDVPPSVIAAGANALLHHRTPEFRRILAEGLENLKKIHLTKRDVFFFAGSGTSAMEASVSNLLSPGDKVLVASCGFFGHRWAELCKAFGLTVVHEDAPFGTAIDPASVGDALRAHPDIKAVFTTLSETSTGVDTDVEAVAAIAHQHGAIIVVDAVSGLAACEMKMDEWNLDVVASASQKGLMMPPGVAFVSMGERARKMADTAKLPRFYLDLRKMEERLHAESLPDSPWTPPISLIYQLREATRMILEEGMPNVWARHRLLSSAVRAGLQAMGIELFATSGHSSVVTAMKVPGGISADDWMKKLREEFGVSFAPGQGPMKGKVMRSGHVGYCDRLDVTLALSSLEISLLEMGVPVKPGAGPGAAAQVLASKVPVTA